jgi:hypothetical protein
MGSASALGRSPLPTLLLLSLLTPTAWAAVSTAPAVPPREYNSVDHQIVTSRAERDRLLSKTPQWVIQELTWPPASELTDHLGIRDEDQARQAAEMAQAILRPDYVPENLAARWIPLRGWNIFYTDWVNHGGADTFLTNYTADDVRLQLADTPNFVIVAIRPKSPRPAGEHLDEWVLEVVRAMCNEAILPAQAEASQTVEITVAYAPDQIIEGEWTPRGPAERRASQTRTGSRDIERVKFFTDGEIVVISVPKFLWDPTSLVNPFAPRFPAPSGPAEIAAMTQMLFRPESPTPQPIDSDPASMTRLLEQLLRATPSDVLLRDWSRRTRVNLDADKLDRMFNDMSAERKGLWHAQQLSERLIAEGVGALSDQHYDEAATRFSQALILDPLNVSAAMLLEITRDRARDWAVSIDRPLPLPWFEAADQALRRHQNAVEYRRRETQERSQTQLALRDLRTQFLEAYAENDLRQARQILHRMLDLDPGNASTLFFVDMIEGLLAAEEGRTAD